MPRLKGPQELVFVPLYTFKYGYKMNKANFSSFGGALGIKTAVGEGSVYFGANSPKPGIARLKKETGSQSSYYDPGKAKALAKAGWKLSSGRVAAIRTAGKAITVAVDTPHGYDYAWNITAADAKEAIALGATNPTDPTKLVWGSFPKPPRATKRDASGSSFSTFVAPTQAKIDAANALGYSVEGLDGDWLNI